MNCFEFIDYECLRAEHGGQIFRVPAGITTKAVLFSRLAEELIFPSYFSSNWDSLDECLGDLSWLEADRVTVVHADIPLSTIEERRTYLDVLATAVETHGGLLKVVFPSNYMQAVKSLRNDVEDS